MSIFNMPDHDNTDISSYTGHVQATVLKCVKNKNGYIIDAECVYPQSLSATKGKVLTRIYTTSQKKFLSGDLILVKGKFNPINQYSGFNASYEATLWRKGFSWTGFIPTEGIEYISQKKNSVLDNLRDEIDSKIDKLYSNKTKNIIKALLLADKHGISSRTKETFIRSGAYHVLAASGLHIGIVAGFFIFILRRLRLSKTTSLIITLAPVLLYLFITGMPVSLLRAGILFFILTAGHIFSLRIEPVNTICIAALIILCLAPAELFSPGFQLSFGATLTIIILYTPLKKVMGPLPHYLSAPLSVTLAAQMATVPLIWFHFGQCNYSAILSSFVLAPLVPLILSGGMISIIISIVSSSAAAFCAEYVHILIRLLNFFLELIASTTGHFYTEKENLLYPVIFCIISVYVIIKKKFPYGKALLLSIIIVLSWAGMSLKCQKNYKLDNKTTFLFPERSFLKPVLPNTRVSHDESILNQDYGINKQCYICKINSKEAADFALKIITETASNDVILFIEPEPVNSLSHHISSLFKSGKIIKIFFPDKSKLNHAMKKLIIQAQMDNIEIGFYTKKYNKYCIAF